MPFEVWAWGLMVDLQLLGWFFKTELLSWGKDMFSNQWPCMVFVAFWGSLSKMVEVYSNILILKNCFFSHLLITWSICGLGFEVLLWPSKRVVICDRFQMCVHFLWNKMYFLQNRVTLTDIYVKYKKTIGRWMCGRINHLHVQFCSFFLNLYIYGSPIYMFVFVFHPNFHWTFVENISILISREQVCDEGRLVHKWLIVSIVGIYPFFSWWI